MHAVCHQTTLVCERSNFLDLDVEPIWKIAMFHFVMPRPDCTVFHVAIGARDLEHAFEQFQRDWFRAHEHTRSLGVWHNSALTARVLPISNPDTGELEPSMQIIKS
jgi:hypothetical protein